MINDSKHKGSQLKEKIVGATALIMLAVIFVPLILDRSISETEELPPLLEKLPEIPELPRTIPEHNTAETTAVDQSARAWVLQAGVFAEQNLAANMAEQLRQSGYRAFVSPDKSSDSNDDRFAVLIGPELDIESLRIIQKDLQRDMKIKGILGRYPR